MRSLVRVYPRAWPHLRRLALGQWHFAIICLSVDIGKCSDVDKSFYVAAIGSLARGKFDCMAY